MMGANDRAAASDPLQDNVNTHQSRWDEMRESRSDWTREAWKDKRVAAGDVFNETEKEWFRDMERDLPNYNLALPMVNLIAGTEAQSRADIKYQPVGPSDKDPAEAITHLARKVARDNKMGRKFSSAFYDSLVTGIGWVEVGYNRFVDGPPIVIDHEDSLSIWTDPASRKLDFSDAQDMCRSKLFTATQVARLFPWAAKDVRYLKGVDNNGVVNYDHSSDYSNDYGDYPSVSDETHWGSTSAAQRGRTRLLQVVERWYRVDRWATIVRHRDGRWWEVSEANAYQLAQMLLSGEAEEDAGYVPEYRYGIFCEDLLFGDWASPYKFRGFPFTPIWCYQDHNGQPMSIIRLIRSAAKDFNARMNALLMRTLKKQVWIEEDAVSDLDKMIEEYAQPDGVVVLRPGAIRNQKVLIKDEIQHAPIDGQLLEIDMKFITDKAGVTEEMGGQRSNADSGVAIQKKINQSQTALYTLFDNRSAALQEVGERLLPCIQEKYTAEMAVRVTESQKGLQWISINKKDPMTGETMNDITQARFDIEVSEVPASQSVQLAKFEALAQFLAPMPTEVKLLFAAKMADLADIPDSEEVAAKLDAFTQRMMGTGGPPPITPELVAQLVQEGHLTQEGALMLIDQAGGAAAAQASPMSPEMQASPQGPGAQPGPSAPTPAGPPAAA